MSALVINLWCQSGSQTEGFMEKLILLVFAALILSSVQVSAALKSTSVCSLTGEGVYEAQWKKHRLVIGEKIIFGSDDMQSVIEVLKSAKTQGFCI